MVRILIVMGGFFPGNNYGGPPVSVDNFCTFFQEYQVYIITRDHDNGDCQRYADILDGWNDRGNCKVWYLADAQYKYDTFFNICKSIEPDWVYLQGLFQACIVPCLIMAKVQKRRVLLAPRGELCKGAFKKKWKKVLYIFFLRMFRLLNGVIFQSTSEEETEAIKHRLHIEDDYVFLIPNLPSISQTKKKKRRKKAKGRARLVYISRIVPKKNLHYAFERLKDIEGEIIFDIYGAKEDERYWNRCEESISRLPNNVDVRYCGVLEHDSVMETFAEYDAFVFPTLSENYGHVIVESLLAGCPVITSTETPWRGLEEEKAGRDVHLDDEAGFSDAIQWVIDANQDIMDIIRVSAENYIYDRLEIDCIEQAYRNVFG